MEASVFGILRTVQNAAAGTLSAHAEKARKRLPGFENKG